MSGRVWRRIGRGAALVVAVVLGLLGLLVALVLLPPVRGVAFDKGLSALDEKLPGSFTVRAAWSSPGRLVLSDFLWMADGDTVCAARRVEVKVRLRPILAHDVHVERLLLEGVRFDVSALQKLSFPPPDTTASAGKRKPPRFPGPGAIAGIPSVSVDSLFFGMDVLRISPDSPPLSGEIAASLDLRDGHRPRVEIHRFRVDGAESWWTNGADLVLAGATPESEGHALFGLASLPTVRLAARGEEKGLRLVLYLDEQEPPPAGAGLDLQVEPRMAGNEIQAILLTALLKTPSGRELATWPALADRAARIPDLEPVVVDLRGELRLGASLEADLGVVIHENAWLSGGRVDARYAAGVAVLDSLRVDLPGLSVRARGRSSPRALGVHAEADLTGLEWLAAFDVVPPTVGNLVAHVDVDLEGEPKTPALQLALEASGVRNGRVVEAVHFSARCEELGVRPLEWDLGTRVAGVEATLEGRVERGEEVEVALSPLYVRDLSRAEMPPPSTAWGRVTWNATTRAVTVKDVRLTGDLGEVRFDGTVDGGSRATMRVAAEWAEAPSILLRALRLTEETSPEFLMAWRRDAPYRIAAEGSVASIRGFSGVQLQGEARLPGPRQFAAFFSDSTRVDDLGPVTARFQVTSAASGTGEPHYEYVFDVGETDWIEAGAVRGSYARGGAVLDSLALAVEDVAFGLRGAAGDTLDLGGSLQLGPAFLGRFAPVGDIRGRLLAKVAGTRAAPRLEASFDGAYARGTTSIPRIVGTFALSLDAVRARFEMPQGIHAAEFVLDSLSVSVASEADTLFPARIAVSAVGPDLALLLGAVVDSQRPRWDMRADRLSFSVYGRGLEAQRPFHVRGDSTSLRLTDLDLAGTLGTVTGEGFWRPDSVTFTLDSDLNVPDPPRSINVLPGLWPDHASVEIDVRSSREADLKARVTGLTLGERAGTNVEVNVHMETGETRVGTRVHDASEDMIQGEVVVPFSMDLGTMARSWGAAPMEGSLVISDLPLPTRDDDKKKATRLDGRVEFRGTPAAPEVHGTLQGSWPGRKELADHVLDVTLEVAAEGGATGRARVDSRAVLRRETREVVTLDLAAPLRIVPDSLLVGLDPELPLAVALRTDTLSLGLYRSLLPRGMTMKGKLRLDGRAEGLPGALALSGTVAGKGITVSDPQGSKVTFDAGLTLGGTSARPSVTGGIEVLSGLIVVPEVPKELHPVTGDAALWKHRVEADSSSAPSPRREPEVPPMDLDVTLRVPATLYIRSREMLLGLSGNLNLKQSGAVPVVVGELKATSGKIKLLGRDFIVNEGSVTFYGGDEEDPTIDVTVGTRVDDVDIRVTVTGTARKPELAMESTPDMEESDIMSLILLGRTTEDLSDSQMDLLGERAGQMATAYVSAGLSQTVGKRLGLDHVALDQGTGDDEGTTLTVGKYLNPRTLMTYQQALAEGEQFVVGLRYLLTQHFGLDTTYDSEGNSAVKLSLQTEY